MSEKTFFESAVFYSDFGWRVFPLIPNDKKPLIKEWQSRATTDYDTICTWWRKWDDANIGIATGLESGIIVIDIDIGKDGEESLADLEQRFSKLPPAPEVITGSGGRHLYVETPHQLIRNSASKLGSGLDIRGNGGYVCAPPSIHPNGNPYTWKIPPDQITPPIFPDWLADLLITQNNHSTRTASGELDPYAPPYWTAKAEKLVKRGQGRNEIGFWLACKLRDCGLEFDQARMWIRYFVCRVPRRDHPYTADEAEASLLSAYGGQPIDKPKDEKFNW